MVLCDGKLVYRSIAPKLYHLHTVQKRLGYGVHGICGTDEQHIRKIVGNVQVMIRKGIVLLGIQHLQKSACGVTVVAL